MIYKNVEIVLKTMGFCGDLEIVFVGEQGEIDAGVLKVFL